MNGSTLRNNGLDRVESKGKQWVNKARAKAIEIAAERGMVTINEVREVIELPEDLHPNTWGAVMRTSRLQACGFTRATHPGAHARFVNTYKLVR